MEDGITTEINTFGTQIWKKDGLHHRDGDKPAVVYESGRQEWWVDDQPHRDGDKPAVVCANGDQEWWVDDQKHRDIGPAWVELYGTIYYTHGSARDMDPSRGETAADESCASWSPVACFM